jgi:hypothetical protein
VNDSELNDLLRQARVPERSEQEWKESAEDTVRALNHRRDKLDRLARPRAQRIVLWSVGLATACVLAGFFFGQWRAGRNAPQNEIADARKLFAELNAMFPDRLQAVVLDGTTPRLVLAEKISGEQGPPLYVRLCGARGCQRVITYSGQRVSLNGETCEVLLDARGHIIVTGERFAWSSGDKTLAGGYRIEAAPLTGAL